ncbi:MAG: isopeptide-forming domain-containing fimbrial protein [Clostridiales bacterium]|nr:isopeptide-forming domain-containing fimbrial protein [Clostridiales bacterium]
MTVDSNGYVTWNTASAAGASDFAKAALTYAQDSGITATDSETATSTTVTFTDLEYGYYLIDSSLGTLCTLDSTDPNVTVTDKNGAPTVDKEVQEDSTSNWGETNTADIAEVVNFRTEIANAYSVSNLVLHDTMSEGLTLDSDSITVQVGSSLSSASGTVDSKYYTISIPGTVDGCTFEISFTDEFTSTILQSTQVIIVSYSATVNSDAVIGSTGNTNETHVEYGNESESTSVTTITYVYDLYIYKYTETTSGNTTTETALAGAKFVLYKAIDGVNYYAVLDSDYNVTGWTIYKTQDDIDAALAAGTIIQAEADAASYATEVVSGSDGLIHINGLDVGSYYLEETEAPTGYSMLSAAVSVNIGTGGTVSAQDVTVGTVTVGTDDYTAIKIKNGTGTEMPSTGGIGTTIFYVVGGVLVVGAVVVLITRKRMNKD